MLKPTIGIALTLSILGGCATSNGDATKEGGLWDAIVNDVGGGYDRRTKKLEDELEKSQREKKEAEEEQQRLKAKSEKESH
jgi:hypothetical protein